MTRLDAGIPNMKKLQARKDEAAINASKMENSCINYDNLIMASNKVKPKNISLQSVSKQLPRDEKLYRQDDRWSNIMLENTKEEREIEIQARTQQNRKFPMLFKPWIV